MILDALAVGEVTVDEEAVDAKMMNHVLVSVISL